MKLEPTNIGPTDKILWVLLSFLCSGIFVLLSMVVLSIFDDIYEFNNDPYVTKVTIYSAVSGFVFGLLLPVLINIFYFIPARLRNAKKKKQIKIEKQKHDIQDEHDRAISFINRCKNDLY